MYQFRFKFTKLRGLGISMNLTFVQHSRNWFYKKLQTPRKIVCRSTAANPRHKHKRQLSNFIMATAGKLLSTMYF